MRYRSVPLLFTLACGLITTSALSAIITYRATGAFTSSDFPLEVPAGNHFTLDFTLDDSVLDTDTRSIAGSYPGALVSAEFRLGPESSTGTYPGGSTTSQGVIATSNYSGLDRFYLRLDGGTFPALGGRPFGGLLFVLNDPTQTSSISDPGGSPSLAAVLHGALNLSEFGNTTVRLSAVDKNGTAEGAVTSLMVVPEPGAVLLLATGSAFMNRRRHRSRQ